MPLCRDTPFTLQDGKGCHSSGSHVNFPIAIASLDVFESTPTLNKLESWVPLFFVKEFLLNISVNITINTFCPLNKILYCSYSATVNSFVHLNSFFFYCPIVAKFRKHLRTQTVIFHKHIP